MAETTESPELQSDEELQPRVGGRMLIMAFVGLVIMLETAMFFFLVPSASKFAHWPKLS